jgi:arylsulfatase A-like enzyme
MVRIAVILGMFVGCPGLHAADQPINVVLIVADDLGWRDLGCYGSTFYKTPHLDRMAKDGLRFTNFYAACPVCSPTRASILTGKYPQRMNITDWIPGRKDQPDQRLQQPQIRTELPREEVTIAEALKALGYVTAHIGKWHLGGRGFGPEHQGFDWNIAGDETGTPRSYFAPFENKLGTMPGLEKSQPGEYLTDRLASEAEKFIEANRAKPFFLYWPHYAVHTPLRAKKETIAKYTVKPQHGQQSHPIYAAMVESLDEAIGRVLKKLEDLNLAERTLVIFTSDNGGLATLEGMPFAPTINAPLREGKGYLYEGGIRVPCIVKWPGVVKPGSTTSEVACTIDLFDTILDAANRGARNQPKPAGGSRDGLSLLPVFAGEQLKQRVLFWHYPHYANQGSRPGGGLRAGDYKLIEDYETGRRELFNLRMDLSESRNLAAEQPKLVEQLAKQLDEWRKEVGAKMPRPNPGYRPNPQSKDGSITLHARTAVVNGTQLRFEPLPHKNTLGFWTNQNDSATFEFTVENPGLFTVEILHGCGKGSGGAVVELSLSQPGAAAPRASLAFTVAETGGFQNFEAREVGTVEISRAGRHTLTVAAKTKPGVAVMDLRQIVLKPKTELANRSVWPGSGHTRLRAGE